MKPKNLETTYVEVSCLKAMLCMYIASSWECVTEYEIDRFKDLLARVVNACNNTIDYLSKEE